MSLTWMDWTGLAAEAITFIGLPTLALSMWRLWREVQNERLEADERRAEEACREIVSVGCQFSDEHAAINLVVLEKVVAFPRPGHIVFLPGETRDRRNWGGGTYDVERVSSQFFEAPEINQPCGAFKGHGTRTRTRARGQ